jgi:hypothetical protein
LQMEGPVNLPGGLLPPLVPPIAKCLQLWNSAKVAAFVFPLQRKPAQIEGLAVMAPMMV